MSAQTYQESFRIPATHPSLPGHFPGNPVVPGVVILDQVAGALERWRGTPPAGLPQVKFLLPLLPGQEAQLDLTDGAGRLRFHVRHADRVIATGEVQLA
ncbi:hydroxymyristoyl-ACP dehydratase [Tahibacter amnicola]|uniref:Hydroxymyristoyl-ACP dehydratase n=1 Tax=Tahibacter amnicola TaxID=2976241 RepID=A0ABY6BFA2_9GAMM|nr:hydroxymyristoyl-ACP dehydratase [Tahibacter amnicola]UXI68708.1 hydroxymyristoyl-ACP dehydratase [Tahibacter amnicola]